MRHAILTAGALSLAMACTPAAAAGPHEGGLAGPDRAAYGLPIAAAPMIPGQLAARTQTAGKPVRLAQKNRKSLARIRAAAISRSMARLEQLRPYATNFARLKAAVRAYWMRNVHRPHAGRLTNTILRHVSPEHRSLVRGPVYQSALDGTQKVRAALAN